ncbi:MAG TPA: hypothetical protein VJH94_01650 [Candidatus Paceibacterota bacterium]
MNPVRNLQNTYHTKRPPARNARAGERRIASSFSTAQRFATNGTYLSGTRTARDYLLVNF